MRIARQLRSLNQRGDTLVEVLVAIAVVSMVLGGAYVTTNKSLRGTRDAQEHSNALKLVEGQVEQIKNLASTNPDAIFVSAPASFCISNTGAVVNSSNAACAVDANGNPTGTEPVFRLAITRTGNLFNIRNTWTSNSGVTANEQIKYRIYQ